MFSIFKLYTNFFSSIYKYREYLKQSVYRDLRKRYRRTFLGYLWSMLQPLFMMIILAVVFSHIMRQGIEDYAVFLFTGMIPWAYFNLTTRMCINSVRSNAKIVEQISVPRFIFPVSYAFFGVVDLLFSLVPLMLVMLVLGRDFHLTALALPLVILPIFFVAMGLGLIFAAANVFFEDTEHLVGIFLQALYYLCPILYSRELLPEWLMEYIIYNPMFTLIEFHRDIWYYGKLPDLEIYSISLLGTFLCLGLGLWIFNRAEKKFVYYI